MTDEMAEGAQPDAGQGAEEAGGGSPWGDYLNRIPEESRDEAAAIFREMEANATRKFQEHADFRRNWEPLQDTGIQQYSPEQVQWATQFLGALDNPQTIQQWYEQYAQQHGLTPAQAAQAVQADSTLDEFGGLYDQGALERALDSRLGPLTQRLEALAHAQEQQEQQARIAEAQVLVQQQWDEQKSKHPDTWNDEAVEGLISKYIESDPEHAVERASAEWQAIYAGIERASLQAKARQPAGAEGGGGAVGAAEEIKTLQRAGEIAREQIRQSHAA